MQPVWVLSVDLQTKTATFQSGLGDAARSARGAFNDIKGGSGEMGRAVSGNMMEARHGVMLLGEEFGIHLPRALTSFIASIGPIGAVMEAAFPFLAIAVGATLLIEHLVKMHEAGEKLTEDQLRFGTAANNAFNSLDEKITQAKIKADELRGDHFGALALQLDAIDKQSMAELVHSFEEVAKAADIVMKELKGSWYTFGIGSDGAQHALDEFKNKYENLLSLHTKAGEDEANNLLTGTLKTARDVLQAQQAIKANRDSGEGQTDASVAAEHLLAVHRASLTVTHDEIAAQEQLVGALQKQKDIKGAVTALANLDGGNAKKAAANAAAGQAAAGQRQAAESQLRMGEQVIAADRAVSNSQLAIQRASIQERLDADLDFANREYQLRLAANQQETAALDKSGKDYHNQLKALQDKALELTQAHDTQIAELTAKAATESNAKELRILEQGERAKIGAIQKGSAARLAAMDAAIKEEESRGLQDTSFYRELLNQRIDLALQMAEEEKKLKEEAGREEASDIKKMGELAIAALRQAYALQDSARRVNDAQKAAEETTLANAEFNNQMQFYARELSALDKSGKDYNNKLKAIQDKEKQQIQQHENEIAAIKEKAEIASNARILSANQRFQDALASGLSQTIMGHQSFAKMMSSLGDQVVSGMLQNVIKSILMDDMTKEKDAAAAARKAFNIGMGMGPAGIVLGPVFGAAAFAAVMAFEGGGIVPGVGRGDTVPAMLTPGEGVVPKGVMEGLSNMSKFGGMQSGGSSTVVHVRPVYHVQTIDGNGMKAALEKHTDVLQRHFENTLRKMNR